MNQRRLGKRTTPLLIGALALSIGSAVGASASGEEGRYWNDRERGWFWGEVDPEPPEPKEVQPPEPKAEASPEPEKSATERLEEFRAKVDEAKAKAVLNPTEENVSAYMALQKELMDKSAVFADVWKRAMWSQPDLGYAADKPIAGEGLRERRRIESAQVQKAVDQVKQDRGLFFFYASPENCPYCEVQSQHISRFADTYGIEAQAVSLDGSDNEYFPNARPDNGVAEAFGVKQVPALFLVNPDTRKVDSLGYGVITDATIGERLRTVLIRDLGEF